jgi:hypothetical protein
MKQHNEPLSGLQHFGIAVACSLCSRFVADQLGLVNSELFQDDINWLHASGRLAIFGVLYFLVVSLANHFGLANYTFSEGRLLKKPSSVSLPASEPSSKQSHHQVQTK